MLLHDSRQIVALQDEAVVLDCDRIDVDKHHARLWRSRLCDRHARSDIENWRTPACTRNSTTRRRNPRFTCASFGAFGNAVRICSATSRSTAKLWAPPNK
jgi:hypothetical protein